MSLGSVAGSSFPDLVQSSSGDRALKLGPRKLNTPTMMLGTGEYNQYTRVVGTRNRYQARRDRLVMRAEPIPPPQRPQGNTERDMQQQ
jgi:hypothetical protein